MIDINNFTSIRLNKRFLKRISEFVLKSEKRGDFYLSIVFVGLVRMKRLNKKYLNRDYPTDVLAFSHQDKILKNNILGEIIICPHTVKKNAKEFNSSFKKELARVLIHGILHLLGYDHEKSQALAEKMRKKEEYYLKKINW